MNKKQRETLDVRLYLGQSQTPFMWESMFDLTDLPSHQRDLHAFALYGQNLHLKRYTPPPYPFNQPLVLTQDDRLICPIKVINITLHLLTDLSATERPWVLSCFSAYLQKNNYRVPPSMWSKLCPYFLALFPKKIPIFKTLLGPTEHELIELNPESVLNQLINHSTHFHPPPDISSSQIDRFNQLSDLFQLPLHSLIDSPPFPSNFKKECHFLLEMEEKRLSSAPTDLFPLPLLPLDALRHFHAYLSDQVSLDLQKSHQSPQNQELIQKNKHQTLLLKTYRHLLCRLSLSPHYQLDILEDLDLFNHPFELAQPEVMYLCGSIHFLKQI